jgi:TatD DNase family protein
MIDDPPLIDTHAHLADLRLKTRIGAVLRAAREAGVVQVVAVGTTAVDSASVLKLADEHPGVYASVGIHPNEAAEAEAGDWDRIGVLARRPGVVAIGETGLDRHWDRTPFHLQQDFFDRHLDLARELGRPVIIHSRDCHADIVAQLAGLNRPIRGVLHSFTGSRDEARQILDLGLHLSFAGMLTFANKALDPLREAAAFVPVDRLMVETDSPYLSPHPHRGQSNEPARVVFTAARLAEIRGISLAELAEATTKTARELFSIPPSPMMDPG